MACRLSVSLLTPLVLAPLVGLGVLGCGSDGRSDPEDGGTPADAGPGTDAGPRDGGGDGGPGDGGPAGEAPTVDGLDDVTVVQNTMTDAMVDVSFTVADPDGNAGELTVQLGSDDGDVVPDPTASCTDGGNCTTTLTVHRSEAATVQVTVTATDPGGLSGSGTFSVEVAPRPVTNAADGGDGSLRGAVGASEPGDVIGFDLTTPALIVVDSHITIEQTVAIEGPGSDQVTIDGDSMSRIFDITADGDLELSGVMLRDGDSSVGDPEDGGCIRNVGTLTIRDSVLTMCEADGASGGAVHNEGTLVVEGSELSASRADFGGAVYSRDGSVRIETSMVTANDAGATGGAVYTWDDTEVTASTFAGNTAMGGGGAILNDGADLSIGNSTFADNVVTAGGGGAVFNASGTARIMLTTVTDNEARAMSSGDVTRGGGLYNSSGTMEVGGSIVYGNISDDEGPDLWGTVSTSGYNVVGDPAGATFMGSSGSHLVGTDPLLGELRDNGGPTLTREPAGGSPAIDLVPLDACVDPFGMTEGGDQRLMTRPMGGSCDAGSVEAG